MKLMSLEGRMRGRRQSVEIKLWEAIFSVAPGLSGEIKWPEKVQMFSFACILLFLYSKSDNNKKLKYFLFSFFLLLFLQI